MRAVARGAPVAVAAGLALAACEARPLVFGPSIDRLDDPSRLIDTGDFALADKLVVFVNGIDNAPQALDAALRPALAERLLSLDIGASVQSANRASYILEAAARRDAGGGRTVAWRLIDADGLVVGLMDQRVPGGDAAWTRGGAALAAALIDEAAPRLAALIRGDALRGPSPAPAAGGAAQAFAVEPVAGAPGNGGAALADAARAALLAAGFALAPPGPGTLRLIGAVAVTPGAASDRVAVAWRIVASDGSRIGAFEQSGQVEPGTLDGAWGGVADAIAEGAALGVAEVLAAYAPPEKDP